MGSLKEENKKSQDKNMAVGNKSMLAIALAFFLVANFCDATQNQAEVQCYQYTWVGAKSSNTNSTTCESIKSDSKFGDHIPCFYPLVWTENGPNSHNQPDPRDIANACANASTSDNQKCNPYCNKNDGMCVKMTYTLRDGSGTVSYMSSFCGKGVDTTDNGHAIGGVCYSQYNVENSGHDLEACFCDNDLCNSANGRFLQKFIAFSCALVYVLVLNVFDDFI